MDQRKLARGIVYTVMAVTIVFVAFAVYSGSKQASKESELQKTGVEVIGTVVRKHKPSGGQSSSTSYVIDVKYKHKDSVLERSFSVNSSRYDELKESDEISITFLPNDPTKSQLTEVLGKSLNGRGFIVD